MGSAIFKYLESGGFKTTYKLTRSISWITSDYKLAQAMSPENEQEIQKEKILKRKKGSHSTIFTGPVVVKSA